MAKGRKRNPNSYNQRLMTTFFGKNASKYASDHNTWPKQYNKLYWRLWNKDLLIVPAAEYKEGQQAIKTLHAISDSICDFDTMTTI